MENGNKAKEFVSSKTSSTIGIGGVALVALSIPMEEAFGIPKIQFVMGGCLLLGLTCALLEVMKDNGKIVEKFLHVPFTTLVFAYTFFQCTRGTAYTGEKMMSQSQAPPPIVHSGFGLSQQQSIPDFNPERKIYNGVWYVRVHPRVVLKDNEGTWYAPVMSQKRTLKF